jgi:VanZ family protein
MKFHKNRILIWILLFLVMISTTNKNVSAANDKLLHFGISSVFGAASESYLHYKTKLKTPERIILGTALGSVPGLAKEIIDSTKKGDYFSGGDLAADIAGSFVGAVIGNFVNNIIQVKVEKKRDEKKTAISLTYKF